MKRLSIPEPSWGQAGMTEMALPGRTWEATLLTLRSQQGNQFLIHKMRKHGNQHFKLGWQALPHLQWLWAYNSSNKMLKVCERNDQVPVMENWPLLNTWIKALLIYFYTFLKSIKFSRFLPLLPEFEPSALVSLFLIHNPFQNFPHNQSICPRDVWDTLLHCLQPFMALHCFQREVKQNS